MKTTLLFCFLLASLTGFCQTPIFSYYNPDGSTYAVENTSIPINESASGGNATWTFNGLAQVGTTVDTNESPTATEVTTYPFTTAVSVSTSTVDLQTSVGRVFSKNSANEVSITGLTNTQITLNFAANNAKVGVFPMEFGYLLIDNLAGTFTSGATSGDVTGTITTSVDAFGTLNLNFTDAASYSQPVTRFKSVQNISLKIGLFTIGTIVQTINYYYASNATAPIFRSSTIQVNVPVQGINETFVLLEKFLGVLGVNQNQVLANTIKVFPNPAKDYLTIQNESEQPISALTITDMSGRVVTQSNYESNSINVSSLQKGIYFLSLTTNKGKVSKKFIKE